MKLEPAATLELERVGWGRGSHPVLDFSETHFTARRPAAVDRQPGMEGRVSGKATFLDLVAVIAEMGASDDEVVSTVVWLVNEGHVKLLGEFREARLRIG